MIYMEKALFDITGMTCSACSARIEKGLSKLDGIKEVSVNLLTNSMAVNFDAGQINTNQIVKKVEDIGYGASNKPAGIYRGDICVAACVAVSAAAFTARYAQIKVRVAIGFCNRIASTDCGGGLVRFVYRDAAACNVYVIVIGVARHCCSNRKVANADNVHSIAADGSDGNIA